MVKGSQSQSGVLISVCSFFALRGRRVGFGDDEVVVGGDDDVVVGGDDGNEVGVVRRSEKKKKRS